MGSEAVRERVVSPSLEHKFPNEGQHADVVVILARTLKQRWDENACVKAPPTARVIRGGVKA